MVLPLKQKTIMKNVSGDEHSCLFRRDEEKTFYDNLILDAQKIFQVSVSTFCDQVPALYNFFAAEFILWCIQSHFQTFKLFYHLC
jgi:hypothetical protein